MNPSFGKNKGPYHGIWIVIIALVAVPAIFYFIFHSSLLRMMKTADSLFIRTQAQVFAGACSVCFCVILMVNGMLADSFNVVCKRLGEFFEALRYESVEHAFKWYWENAKDQGYCFWIYLILIIGNVWYLLDGIISFIHQIGL